MPDKPHTRLKCPYCQSDLDLTVNKWLHCRRCSRDIILASPEREPSSACFTWAMLAVFMLILVYLAMFSLK